MTIIENTSEREEAARLFLAIRQARDAYADHPLTVFEANDGSVLRCGITGVPIISGDEYVEDLETGECFLRSALGLPPRPDMVVQAEEEDEDEASEFEDA